jgi:tRNA guanosine-2'-O-methyltransferase
MSAIRGQTASLLLDRIPENERLKVVRDVTKSLDAKSSNADIGFAATLWRLNPDQEAKETLLDHLQKQVENGSDQVSAVPDLEQDVLARVIEFIAQSRSSVGSQNSEWFGVPLLNPNSQEQTNGTVINENVGSPSAVDHIVNCLRFTSRLVSSDLPDLYARRLFNSCLILVGAAEKTVSSCAQEVLYALLAVRPQFTADEQEALWQRIQDLTTSADSSFKTIGFSLWLRWNIGQQIDASILCLEAYWNLIVDGLRNGDAERRKSALQILRSSIDTSLRDASMVSMVTTGSESTTPSKSFTVHSIPLLRCGTSC